MFNSVEYIIDKVRRVTEVDLVTNLVNWTATSIENPQVEFTGDSSSKTDAYGVEIAKFDTAKGVTFSGEASMLNTSMMAAQLGTERRIASSENKLTGTTFEIVTVKDKKATLTYTPSTAPANVYTLSSDKNIASSIEVGTGTDKASITGKEITMPDSFTGTQIGVLYTYETESAVMIVDNSEEFASAAMYLVDVMCCDTCNQAAKRYGTLVFPKAKIDNNFSVNLTTEGTHPFSFTALKDYCADEALLCYWIFNE